jgi:hypothetical protein
VAHADGGCLLLAVVIEATVDEHGGGQEDAVLADGERQVLDCGGRRRQLMD